MSNQSTSSWVLITLGLLALCAIGVAAVWRMDSAADRGSGLPAGFTLDVQDQWNAGQDQLGYVERTAYDLAFEEVHGIAVGPQDQIYVTGDQGLQVLDSEGQQVQAISLGGSASCLAVGTATHAHPGRIYVSLGNQIEFWELEGGRIGAWTVPGEAPLVTSIAVADQDVFVADAASRRVFRFDLTGKLLTTIGEALDSQTPGFIVTSPFFDVAIASEGAMATEGMLYVANPGARRLERYSFDGDLESIWGNTSSQIAGFFGCCNPVHFAVFSDGRFVTSEKGIPRVKIYRANGDFSCLVAGPPQLGLNATDVGDPRKKPSVFEVAVDQRQRVLVLDPAGSRVVIYESVAGQDSSNLEGVDE